MNTGLAYTLVAVGGLLGSAARYGVVRALRLPPVQGASFPLGTLAVNVLGTLVIAWVSARAGRAAWLTAEARIFLTTGFCGGFTTFSSLMLDVFQLGRERAWGLLIVYVSATVLLGLGAFWLGDRLGR